MRKSFYFKVDLDLGWERDDIEQIGNYISTLFRKALGDEEDECKRSYLYRSCNDDPEKANCLGVEFISSSFYEFQKEQIKQEITEFLNLPFAKKKAISGIITISFLEKHIQSFSILPFDKKKEIIKEMDYQMFPMDLPEKEKDRFIGLPSFLASLEEGYEDECIQETLLEYYKSSNENETMYYEAYLIPFRNSRIEPSLAILNQVLEGEVLYLGADYNGRKDQLDIENLLHKTVLQALGLSGDDPKGKNILREMKDRLGLFDWQDINRVIVVPIGDHQERVMNQFLNNLLSDKEEE